MILYRIASKAYIRDLSGSGALLHGGRWNAKGVRMLYTSQSLSLAALEVIANTSGSQLNNNLFCVELELPDHLPIDHLDKLPNNWNVFPYRADTVKTGNDFITKGGLCLKVPSAIISTEFNLLLNPLHDDFRHVKFLDARPLILDQRLFK